MIQDHRSTRVEKVRFRQRHLTRCGREHRRSGRAGYVNTIMRSAGGAVVYSLTTVHAAYSARYRPPEATLNRTQPIVSPKSLGLGPANSLALTTDSV